MLVCLPTQRAVLYIIVLTFVSIAEWPVMLSRGLNDYLYLTVLLRTALFVVLLLDIGHRLGQYPGNNARQAQRFVSH